MFKSYYLEIQTLQIEFFHFRFQSGNCIRAKLIIHITSGLIHQVNEHPNDHSSRKLFAIIVMSTS